jgi:mannose-6-phosphate isomerase-like protein (cupin superfamily)
MPTRRVVTGRDSSGRSVFVSDGELEATTVSLLPGYEFQSLWGADTIPILPTDGTEPVHPSYFPPPHGFRVGTFTVPPDATGIPDDLDIATALGELGSKLPGMADVMEPDNPGMHTTATVDVELVISGEIWLELDDGEERHLRAGDVVVQNGTRHAWRNKSDQPCTMLVVLIGAVHDPEPEGI